MALPINITDLLSGKLVESERLEFKTGWNPEAVLHTMCAFANDFHNLGGGYLVIGVEEKNGLPVLPPVGIGAGSLDAMQKEMLHLGHSAIQPPYHPLLFPEVVDGRRVLVIWVPGGPARPYKAKATLAKDAREWRYYLRKGSSTVRASGPDEQELMGLANQIPFDDRVNQQATMADLDLGLIRTFLRAIRSDLYSTSGTMDFEALCRQMQLVDGPPEATFPRNVGLMFFNEEPHRFFPQCQIDVVHFPDGAGGDRFEEKIFRGPVDGMLREALAFVQARFISEGVIKRPDRAEADRFFNFPFEAVEEALANAVYHRGYDTREPVEVRISPEEMVIINYPGPDRSVKLDQLREGKALPRRYRNRRIGDFLKELDVTEGRATGIPKMLRVMKRNGSPAPVFEFDEDHSYFMVRLPVHEAAEPLGVVSPPGQPDAPQEGQVESGLESGLESILHRSLQSLASRPLSKSEIAGAIGQQAASGKLHERIRQMLTNNLIERTIPNKPNSRLQKYRLTVKGRALLAQNTSTPSQS